MEGTGIYIHIPFCVSKCGYCDFYSVKANDELMDRYTNAVINAINNNPYGNIVADTLYFGGGTPILLGEKRLSQIIEACADKFILRDAEITIEANPYSTLKNTLSSLKESGVNRISFGLQSAVDSQLKVLSRNHTADEAKKAVNDAFAAGFNNISLDLMLGIPYQTIENLEYSISFCSTLGVQHISAYILKIEKNTAFGKLYKESDFDEDLQSELYLYAINSLHEKGFTQYEISNFSKPNFESRHNLKYWKTQNYLGIGASAHSFMDGNRFLFAPNLVKFIESKNPFDDIVSDGAGGDFDEFIMLGLRLSQGVSFDEIEKRYSISRSTLIKKAQKLLPYDLVFIDQNKISLTKKGFLLSNSVISELLL